MTLSRCVLLLLVCVCGIQAHTSMNPLWECRCWDYYTNEALKRLNTPTVKPTAKPTTSPLPANWPEFLKPEFWEEEPWKNP